MDEAETAVKYAQDLGCQYCDARFELIEKQSVRVENGQLEHSHIQYEKGIGLRVLCDGAWAFFSTSDMDFLKDGVANAIKCAKSYSAKKRTKVKLAEVTVFEKNLTYDVKKIPTLPQMTEIALDCDKLIKTFPKIIKSSVDVSVVKHSKYFASSEGAKILQSFYDTTADIAATARHGGVTQSVNTTEGGRGGMEMLILEDRIFNSAKHIADTASKLVFAKAPKTEQAQVVLNPDFVALLTHEILGHPSEADRVLGKEMAWAGGAWWAGMLGNKIGSPQLNVIDDPTIKSSLGWYEFDDEGVKSQKKQLVKDGVLVNHLHSRETASQFGVEPNASMRATSYSFMPLIRMACTCIEKGDWSPQEMIRQVKYGYLISNMKVPSIDSKRYNWSISCQYANLIENGQVGQLLRDVILVGTAPQFFNSIEACGNDFTVRPITNCGKGDPMQQMKMGNGGPSVLATATVKST